METIRVSAKTLDEAITKACIELGVASSSLEYDIVETGSHGIFGIGAKPYVISAKVKDDVELVNLDSFSIKDALRDIEEDLKENASEESLKKEDIPRRKKSKEGRKNEVKGRRHEDRSDRTVYSKPEIKEKVVKEYRSPEKDVEAKEECHVAPFIKEEKSAHDNASAHDTSNKQKAVSFLESIFKGMDLNVNIKAEEDTKNHELSIELSGSDMGVLIGKRGQTLDALQYLTGQVVNKHSDVYIRVKIDTEDYRKRRKETLEKLAKNIAHKVRRTERPVALEPMNPYERRIIHSSLQGEKDILTRSEGEEPYRHVVVYCSKRYKRKTPTQKEEA